jgi:hypothetical protein
MTCYAKARKTVSNSWLFFAASFASPEASAPVTQWLTCS